MLSMLLTQPAQSEPAQRVSRPEMPNRVDPGSLGDLESRSQDKKWACAKIPLTQLDREGDHLIRTPMHARCIPDADTDADTDANNNDD